MLRGHVAASMAIFRSRRASHRRNDLQDEDVALAPRTNHRREHRRDAGAARPCCGRATVRVMPRRAAPAIDEHRRPPWDIERRGRTAADDDRGGARTQTSCDGPSAAAQHMRSTNINGPRGTSRAAVALHPMHITSPTNGSNTPRETRRTETANTSPAHRRDAIVGRDGRDLAAVDVRSHGALEPSRRGHSRHRAARVAGDDARGGLPNRPWFEARSSDDDPPVIGRQSVDRKPRDPV